MCGISGAWILPGGNEPLALVRAMLATLKHRGPDSQGSWADADHGVALAQARLAVVDLSPAGIQPMHSAGGRYTIVFNGEIYNHAQMRQRLEREGGVRAPWRGHSDTETFLAAVEHWGLAQALQAATGMFAFALWDGQARRLTLARDRFGEKPLYYACTPRGLVFGSELKALLASGLVARELDRDAAASFLRFNNIPAPRSALRGVAKLPPAHLAEFDAPDAPARLQPYWSVAQAWRQGRAQPFRGTPEEATMALENRLAAVLKDQMLADVPLGAFLSGGIDSSTIVALMQAQSSQPVRTFSIGFEVDAYNEAELAKAVAQHLGTQHTELYVTPRDALDVIPHLADIYCEPFADSSQIPTHLVARMARQHVTVALSGDAGDEVFGGYNRYLFGPQVQHRMAAWPRPLRQAAAALLDALPPRQWDAIVQRLGGLLPGSARFKNAGEKLAKLAAALPARNTHELYESFVTHWPHPARLVRGASEGFHAPDWQALGLQDLGFAEQMMVQDAQGYLPDDILVKVDRAAMAVSLETRAPFLDHGLYEFAATLPLDLKIRQGVTKWLVRQVLYKHVPPALIDRPKVGFGIPIEHWLRTDLREWAESLLSREALLRVGVFEPEPVRKTWQEHLSGRRNLQHRLWCVLMYQAWHQRHIATSA
jgi:asparagine synthase (glutamine-hydrolysing)